MNLDKNNLDFESINDKKFRAVQVYEFLYKNQMIFCGASGSSGGGGAGGNGGNGGNGGGSYNNNNSYQRQGDSFSQSAPRVDNSNSLGSFGTEVSFSDEDLPF